MEERIYNGFIYRFDPAARNGQGGWVKAGPAPQAEASGRQGQVFANPYRAREEQRKDEDQTFDARRVGVAEQAEARQAATLPYDIRTAQAQATKAEVDAANATSEAQSRANPEMARIAAELQTDNVLGNISAARRQIGEGWAANNVFGTEFFQGIPWAGQNSTNLSASLSGIKGSIINDTLKALRAQSATGSSGYGSLTEREADRLAASVAAIQQTQSPEELLRNLATVERHYRNALALLNGEDPRLPEVAERYGLSVTADQDQPDAAALPMGGSGQQLTNEGSYQPDPGLAGVNSRVSDMIQRGRSEGEIREYLNRVRPGMGDAATGLAEAIQFNNQFPDRAPQIDLESQWVPSSGISSALGEIGMSPLGAGFIGAADTLSAGTLDNLTSNPEMSRAVMAGVQQENPWSYLAGQVGGALVPGVGVEAGLARLGAGRLAAARGSDLVYGAAYGAGSTDDPSDSRIAGALLGGGAGVAGGAIGRGAARVGGRALTGVQDASVRALNDLGVSMTPGQIAGGTLRRWEDTLSSVPVLGNAIRNRRVEGIEDFNQAAFDEALSPIGANTGGVVAEPGIDIARALRGDAYDNALSGVRVSADPQFTQDMSATIAAGRALPEPMASGMDYTLPTRVGQSFDNAGNMTGREYQQSLRGLRRDAAAVERQPYGYDFGQVTRQAEGALEGLLQRQAPGVVEALQDANRANMNVETLRAAVNAARNGTRSDNTGVFMPSQLADAAANTARRFGNNQGTTNQPFYQLSRAGQDVLPSSVPDSGTAGRLMLPLFLGSAAGGAGYAAQDEENPNRGGNSLGTAAVVAALAAAPYSRAGRNTIQQALLAERPDALVRIGEGLYNRDLIAGLLTRGVAPGAIVGQ